MSLSVVRTAKAELVASGTDLSGPCGALKIVRRAAELLHDGAGLLYKPDGHQCDERATDIVCYPNGHIYDCLIDAGHGNEPSWQDKGFVDPSRYRSIGPAPPPVPSPTPPAPPPVTQPYPDEPTWWAAYEQAVADLYLEAGKEFPDSAAAFRWFSRCAYDIGVGQHRDDAKAKHLAALRRALGLP